MMSLKGRAALITGSTRGIGAAIAETYAQAGADVVIHGRTEKSRPHDLLAKLRGFGVNADFIAVDMARDAEQVVNEFYDKTLAARPNVDILVHNAGGHQGDGPFEQVTMEIFQRSMLLHATVPYFLTQRFARRWIEHGRDGRVIMIGSINGMLAEHNSSAYEASKGAQHMMVRSLAVELSRKHIRVNGLAPGMILTDRTQWVDKYPQRGAWVRHHTPNGLVPPADACAAAALFLVSDEAYHVHGQTLMVDGGMSIYQYPDGPQDKTNLADYQPPKFDGDGKPWWAA